MLLALKKQMNFNVLGIKCCKTKLNKYQQLLMVYKAILSIFFLNFLLNLVALNEKIIYIF